MVSRQCPTSNSKSSRVLYIEIYIYPAAGLQPPRLVGLRYIIYSKSICIDHNGLLGVQPCYVYG